MDGGNDNSGYAPPPPPPMMSSRESVASNSGFAAPPPPPPMGAFGSRGPPPPPPTNDNYDSGSGDGGDGGDTGAAPFDVCVTAISHQCSLTHSFFFDSVCTGTTFINQATLQCGKHFSSFMSILECACHPINHFDCYLYHSSNVYHHHHHVSHLSYSLLSYHIIPCNHLMPTPPSQCAITNRSVSQTDSTIIQL
jgi:hypothetical protein